MIYSTERGQTATVMAALGIVTYGGGDWDGDSYTAIFDQAKEIEGEIIRSALVTLSKDCISQQSRYLFNFFNSYSAL